MPFRTGWLAAPAVFVTVTGRAFAHTVEGGHDGQLAFWNAWTLDPWVIVPLLLAAALYIGGVRSAWQRAGRGRGVRRWEVASFTVGMVALFFALIWPLDVLGEQMFSVHMAQHLVLMNLAAPLLVLGAPLQVMIRPLPRSWHRAIARLVQARSWRAGWHWLRGVGVATVLQLAVMWIWHTPQGIELALQDDAVHVVMHTSLLAVALLFWTAVLRPQGERVWVPVVALVATLKLSGLLCIALLLEPQALYLAYGDGATAWGLSRADDEKVGWGLMMTIGSLSYIVAAIALLSRWFARLERTLPAPGAAQH